MKSIDFLETIHKEIEKSTFEDLVEEYTYYKDMVGSNNLAYILLRKFTSQKTRSKLQLLLNKLHHRETNNKKIRTKKTTKIFSIDYIDYIYKNNPTIPENYFPYKDQKLIYDFLKILIYNAYFNELDESVLGKENNDRYIKALENNNTIQFRDGYFELFDFKSSKPFFESLFSNYGLDLFSKKEHEICLDLGAFIGDTAFLIDKYLKPDKIISFEPDKDNFKILKTNLQLNKLNNVVPVNLAVGKQTKTGFIESSGGSSKVIKSKTSRVNKTKIVTIDEYVKNIRERQITFIKMDVEGEELNVLSGAKMTIKKDKPDLLIAIYHKGEHLFEIPKLLKSLVPNYNLRFLALSESSPVIERMVAASVRRI
jgi:FkbM family methyltransferase